MHFVATVQWPIAECIFYDILKTVISVQIKISGTSFLFSKMKTNNQLYGTLIYFKVEQFSSLPKLKRQSIKLLWSIINITFVDNQDQKI